jgi:hypothetical protein
MRRCLDHIGMPNVRSRHQLHGEQGEKKESPDDFAGAEGMLGGSGGMGGTGSTQVGRDPITPEPRLGSSAQERPAPAGPWS